RDLRPVMLDQIAHFFEHYKDLERGKWAKIKGWGEAEQAMDLIREAMDRVKAKA
ncbi:MAG: inorganic diphosphatase, partial [Rhodospirillales bacterium]